MFSLSIFATGPFHRPYLFVCLHDVVGICCQTTTAAATTTTITIIIIIIIIVDIIIIIIIIIITTIINWIASWFLYFK
jgi:hypothetical protein